MSYHGRNYWNNISKKTHPTERQPPNVAVSTQHHSNNILLTKNPSPLELLYLTWQGVIPLVASSRSPYKERQRLGHTNGIWQLPRWKLMGLTGAKPIIRNKETMQNMTENMYCFELFCGQTSKYQDISEGTLPDLIGHNISGGLQIWILSMVQLCHSSKHFSQLQGYLKHLHPNHAAQP